MLEFDPGADFKDSIELILAKIKQIPEADTPMWVDDQIAEIEIYEKEDEIEIVRRPEDVELMLKRMADELKKLYEIQPLDEIENTNERYQAIQRIERCRNYLMVKAELLYLKAQAEQVKTNTPRKGSQRADTRIIWISGKRSPELLLARIAESIALPPGINSKIVARAHFFCRSHPTPVPSGVPSPIRWLDDLKVLALFFEELAVFDYIQKGQLKKVAQHFVDREGCAINPDSFLTLHHKASNQANIKVEKLVNDFEKIL